MTNKKVCLWTEVSDDWDIHWDTACHHVFCFIEASPKENGMKFCCYCGKKLREVGV